MNSEKPRQGFLARLLRFLAALLTPTSADDRCGRWVVRFVVLAAECMAQGVDGLALEAESDVGVDAGRDADVGVAEDFLDHDDLDARLQEQSGSNGGGSWERMRWRRPCGGAW